MQKLTFDQLKILIKEEFSKYEWGTSDDPNDYEEGKQGKDDFNKCVDEASDYDDLIELFCDAFTYGVSIPYFDQDRPYEIIFDFFIKNNDK